jgi:hypothetical protein
MNHHTDRHDGPGSPVEIADHASESIRALNHLTQQAAAQVLTPADIDQVVAALSQAADRLPQLLRQIGDLLRRRRQAGLLRVDQASPLPDPASAVTQATSALQQAAGYASNAGRALDAAHQILAHVATSTGGGEGLERHARGPDRAVVGGPGTHALPSCVDRSLASRRESEGRSR